MSDICSLNIRLRKRDLSRFFAVTDTRPNDWETVEAHRATVELYMPEANYAFYDELTTAAVDGLVFFGDHGSGDDYRPASFVSLRNEYLEVPTDNEGYLCIRATISTDNPTRAVVVPRELEEANRYLVAVNDVRTDFDIADGITHIDIETLIL